MTPALVDRMDVADDADGRVAIFTAEDSSREGAPSRPARAPPPADTLHPSVSGLGTLLDSRYAEAAVACLLVVILVVGLLLSRH